MSAKIRVAKTPASTVEQKKEPKIEEGCSVKDKEKNLIKKNF